MSLPIPEIQRTNLESTLLQLKSIGINDPLNFDLIDRPSTEAMIFALDRLHHLSALDDDGVLTEEGNLVGCLSNHFN